MHSRKIFQRDFEIVSRKFSLQAASSRCSELKRHDLEWMVGGRFGPGRGRLHLVLCLQNALLSLFEWDVFDLAMCVYVYPSLTCLPHPPS